MAFACGSKMKSTLPATLLSVRPLTLNVSHLPEAYRRLFASGGSSPGSVQALEHELFSGHFSPVPMPFRDKKRPEKDTTKCLSAVRTGFVRAQQWEAASSGHFSPMPLPFGDKKRPEPH